MDPPAAGYRPKVDTIDQQPSQRTTYFIQTHQYIPLSNKNFQKSSIFENDIQASRPSARTMQRAKSDIFFTNNTQEAQQSAGYTRQQKTYKSSLFDQTEEIKQPQSTKNYQKSSIFTSTNQPQKKIAQSKNSENRQKDHGKDFLFGKSGNQLINSNYSLDYDDYKVLRRTQTESSFQPKLDYNPENRIQKELYGTEISKDHLPTRQFEVKKSEQTNNQEQEDLTNLEPNERRQFENSSSIFGEGKIFYRKNLKKEPKQSRIHQRVKTEEIDSDTYAKSKKQQQQESSIFGPQTKKTTTTRQKVLQEKEEQKMKEINMKKKQNPHISEVFGIKESDFQQQEKKMEKLVPTNAQWATTDSIKNKKDFINDEGEKVDQTPQQKKFDTLKSQFDTHNYKAQEITDKNEKISVKNLKYKGDILSREEKKQSQTKGGKSSQVSKSQSEPKLDDSVI